MPLWILSGSLRATVAPAAASWWYTSSYQRLRAVMAKKCRIRSSATISTITIYHGTTTWWNSWLQSRRRCRREKFLIRCSFPTRNDPQKRTTVQHSIRERLMLSMKSQLFMRYDCVSLAAPMPPSTTANRRQVTTITKTFITNILRNCRRCLLPLIEQYLYVDRT